MTEIYGLFDAADPQNPDRVYTSEAFARLFRTMMRDGIVHNDGDELAVSPTVPAAMSVDVGTGMALVQGRYYINSADLTLSVEAADPSYPRIDRVVVRADLVGRTVHAVVKKGTAAASPVAPPLTRTAETWELSLAQVRVEAGATSILSAKITDERGNANLCGVAAPVYVPSSQLEVVGAVDMQGKALTGLPAPSGSADAARKGYVDSELAAKIGGFGISQIAIDADKNWNGKKITNVGGITGSVLAPQITDVIFSLRPDPTKNPQNLVYSDLSEVLTAGTVLAKTLKAAPTQGYVAQSDSAVTVAFDYKCYHYESGATVEIKVGGEVRGSLKTYSQSYVAGQIEVPLSPGEIMEVYLSNHNPNGNGGIKNVRVYAGRGIYAVPGSAW